MEMEMEMVIPPRIRDVWNRWQVRVMVLLSLTCQVILTISGSRRKQARGSRISALVWVTYLSADYLATASLGAISSNQGSSLQALWAPFLLLHLGGPDTITAYSLEDNTLWLRQLLGLVVQVMLASSIYLRSWSSNPLTFIAIPVFISGIIKYWGRNWALRSAAPDQLGASSLEGPAVVVPDIDHLPDDSGLEFLHMGYSLFPLLKRLYSDLSLPFAEGQRSHSLMVKRSGGRDTQRQSHFAFKVVEVQLGFLYDMLYTKAPVNYSLSGIVFRLISVISIVSALVMFFLLADTSESPRVDVWITHALFIGAISLELYASLFVLIPSDWSVQWLTKSQNSWALRGRNVKWLGNLIKRYLSLGEKRWSGCLAQHNLLSFCMKKRVARCIIGSDLPFLMNNDLLFKIHFWLESHWQRTWKDVDQVLKDLIFEFLIERHNKWAEEGFDYQKLTDLLSHKGAKALKNHRRHKMCGWSVETNEFNRSVLIWHVATDICYYSAPPDPTGDDKTRKEQEVSKTLSDYMVYILLMRPFLLPKWIDGVTNVRDTLREVTRILHGRGFAAKNGAEACNMLIQMYRQSHYQQLKKQKGGKSVLLDGYRLASQLQTHKKLWIMICDVWMEMLTFAASQCEWGSHAQQLSRGGELLTHVYVLMADLGLSQQFDSREHTPIQSQDEGWGWVKGKIPDPYM